MVMGDPFVAVVVERFGYFRVLGEAIAAWLLDAAHDVAFTVAAFRILVEVTTKAHEELAREAVK